MKYLLLKWWYFLLITVNIRKIIADKLTVKSVNKGPLIRSNGIKKIGTPNLFNLYIFGIYKI